MHCNSPFNFSLIFYYKVEIYLRRFHPIIDIRLGWFFCCICALLPKDSVFAQTYFHAYNRKKKKTKKRKRETDPGVPSLKKLMLCERSDVSRWIPYLRLNTQHWWKKGEKKKEKAHPFYCEFITTANREIGKYDTPKHHVFFETVVQWGRSKKPYSTGCRNKIPWQMDCHSPPEANKPHTLL